MRATGYDGSPMSADYKLLIEAAPDGVVVSQRGIVKYANAAALRLLGYERAA